MRNVQINSNFLYLCGRKMKRMTNYLEELNESQRNAVLFIMTVLSGNCRSRVGENACADL